MNLDEFIASPHRNMWIEEPGLAYYVCKWGPHPEIITLANCYSLQHILGEDAPPIFLPYRRFMRKYQDRVPFRAEQVLNYNLARFYEISRWSGYTISGVPQYASPLAMRLYGHSQWLNPYGSEEKPSELYHKMYLTGGQDAG